MGDGPDERKCQMYSIPNDKCSQPLPPATETAEVLLGGKKNNSRSKPKLSMSLVLSVQLHKELSKTHRRK